MPRQVLRPCNAGATRTFLVEITYKYDANKLPTEETTKTYEQGVKIGEVAIKRTWDFKGNLLGEENQTLGSKVEISYDDSYNIPTRIDTIISPTVILREENELTFDRKLINKTSKKLVNENGTPISDSPVVMIEFVRKWADTRITSIEEGTIVTYIEYEDPVLTHYPTKIEKGGVTTSVSYDSLGNITGYSTIGTGNSLGYTFTYDKLNRPKTMQLSNGTPLVTKQYGRGLATKISFVTTTYANNNDTKEIFDGLGRYKESIWVDSDRNQKTRIK